MRSSLKRPQPEEGENEDEGSLLMLFMHLATSRVGQPRLLAVATDTLRKVMEQQDDLGYEKIIRLNRPLFGALLTRITPIYERLHFRRRDTVSSGSRPARRALSTPEALFLTLRHIAEGSSFVDLSIMAGVSMGTTQRVLELMIVTLLVVLRCWRLARICPPTVEECEDLSARLATYLPEAHGFIGVADGAMLCHDVVLMQAA